MLHIIYLFMDSTKISLALTLFMSSILLFKNMPWIIYIFYPLSAMNKWLTFDKSTLANSIQPNCPVDPKLTLQFHFLSPSYFWGFLLSFPLTARFPMILETCSLFESVSATNKIIFFILEQDILWSFLLTNVIFSFRLSLTLFGPAFLCSINLTYTS